MCKRGSGLVAIVQGLPCRLVLGKLVFGFEGDILDLLHEGAVPQVALREQVQKGAWDGRDHDGDKPGHFGGGIHARIDQIQDHDHADDQV